MLVGKIAIIKLNKMPLILYDLHIHEHLNRTIKPQKPYIIKIIVVMK